MRKQIDTITATLHSVCVTLWEINQSSVVLVQLSVACFTFHSRITTVRHSVPELTAPKQHRTTPPPACLCTVVLFVGGVLPPPPPPPHYFFYYRSTVSELSSEAAITGPQLSQHAKPTLAQALSHNRPSVWPASTGGLEVLSAQSTPRLPIHQPAVWEGGCRQDGKLCFFQSHFVILVYG